MKISTIPEVSMGEAIILSVLSVLLLTPLVGMVLSCLLWGFLSLAASDPLDRD